MAPDDALYLRRELVRPVPIDNVMVHSKCLALWSLELGVLITARCKNATLRRAIGNDLLVSRLLYTSLAVGQRCLGKLVLVMKPRRTSSVGLLFCPLPNILNPKSIVSSLPKLIPV